MEGAPPRLCVGLVAAVLCQEHRDSDHSVASTSCPVMLGVGGGPGRHPGARTSQLRPACKRSWCLEALPIGFFPPKEPSDTLPPRGGTKMPSAQSPAAGPHVSVSTVRPSGLISKLWGVRGHCLEKGLVAKGMV